MGGSLQKFKLSSIYSATLGTTTSVAINLPVADCYALVLIIGTASGTSPTLDMTLQTSYDGGSNFVAAPVRSTQKTGSTTVEWFIFRPQLGGNESGYAQVAAATGGQLCKNFVPGMNNRLTFTIGGTNPSFAVNVLLGVRELGSIS